MHRIDGVSGTRPAGDLCLCWEPTVDSGSSMEPRECILKYTVRPGRSAQSVELKLRRRGELSGVITVHCELLSQKLKNISGCIIG